MNVRCYKSDICMGKDKDEAIEWGRQQVDISRKKSD